MKLNKNKKNLLIIDLYPSRFIRYAKDTNGGYGTATKLNGFWGKILNFLSYALIDCPPVYIGYLISILDKSGIQSFYSRNINDAKYFGQLIIVSSIVTYENDYLIAKDLINKGKKVFFAGPFSNFTRSELKKIGANVIPGEPELFINSLNKKQLYDYFYGGDESINLNNLKINNDLNSLPMPSWEKVFNNYWLRLLILGGGKTIPISSSRGCPYSCSYYCTYPLNQGSRVRYRDPVSVVDEIVHWNTKFKIRNFQFRDPVFTINRKHAKEICKEIISRELKINYLVELHLKDVDYELADLLSKSGCKWVYVGVESADIDSMDNSKRFTIETNKQKKQINLLEKNGVKVKAMYIFGYPNDSISSLKATINLSKNIGASGAQFNVFTPYPGTLAYGDYKEKLTTFKYEKYDQTNLVFKHKNLSKIIINKFLTKAYISFLKEKLIKIIFANQKINL